MSENILDAFLITIGLDTSAYRKGEREVSDSFKKTREAGSKAFADIENRGKSAALSFRSLSNELAGLILVFAGAKSITGFASSMLAGEAAAGRLSGNLGLGAPKLIAWQQVVKQLGGDAKDASAALQAMANAQQNFRLTGSTGADADFRGLGITANDLQNLDPSQLLLRLASAGEKMSNPEFANRLQRIGIPQSVIYTLEQGRKAVAAQVTEAERLAHVTDKDIKAAQEFDRNLAKLKTTIEGDVRPELTLLVDGLNTFASDGDNIQIAADVIAGGFAAIGVAAAVAYWPVALLTAGLGAAIRLAQVLHDATPEQRRGIKDHGRDIDKKFLGQLMHGDFSGAWETIKSAGSEGIDLMRNGAGNGYGGNAGAGAKISGASGTRGQQAQAFFQSHGVPAPVALGIVGGVFGESHLDPNATNPTSGAYGLGQWVGSRRDELFRRYGRHPTFAQQLAFMLWELHGGDAGGASVLKQTTSNGALNAIVRSFFRPKQGPETWGDLGRGAAYIRNAQAAIASRPAGSRTVHIGAINVHTNATDAKGIARSIGHELRRNGVIQSANNGLAT